jgi:ABC-type sugar transport system permease subunit
MVVVPIFQSLRFSFYRWDGLEPLTRFIGFENFTDIAKDRVFWKSFWNNIVLVVFSLVTRCPSRFSLPSS